MSIPSSASLAYRGGAMPNFAFWAFSEVRSQGRHTKRGGRNDRLLGTSSLSTKRYSRASLHNEGVGDLLSESNPWELSSEFEYVFAL
jgi:hypothetical protein